jgi:hypothetical protein
MLTVRARIKRVSDFSSARLVRVNFGVACGKDVGVGFALLTR